MSKFEKIQNSEEEDTQPNLELVTDNELGKYEGDLVAQLLASENESTDPEDLRILANSEHRNIRKNVGHNKNTPQDVLATLATDNNPYVRLSVATNTTASAELLKTLLDDTGSSGNTVDIGNTARRTLESKSEDDQALAA